jgi:hypothetical protein
MPTIRIKHTSREGPCLELQTTEAGLTDDEFCKQTTAFREREGIQNDIIIISKAESGVRVCPNRIKPSLADALLFRWKQSVPKDRPVYDDANASPRDVGDENSPIDSRSKPLSGGDELTEKLARDVCMKYWARAPVYGDFALCRSYLSKEDGMKKAHELVFQLCKEKTWFECRELAKNSTFYTTETLMEYLTSTHITDYNRQSKASVQETIDSDGLWYYRFGRHIFGAVKKYLKGQMMFQTVGKESEDKSLWKLRLMVLEKLPKWYVPEKYLPDSVSTDPLSVSEENSTANGPHNTSDMYPNSHGNWSMSTDDPYTNDLRRQLNEALDERDDLWLKLYNLDLLYQKTKSERDALKKKKNELEKELEKLRRPPAPRKKPRRSVQERGNAYAKRYFTGSERRRRPLEQIQEQGN